MQSHFKLKLRKSFLSHHTSYPADDVIEDRKWSIDKELQRGTQQVARQSPNHRMPLMTVPSLRQDVDDSAHAPKTRAPGVREPHRVKFAEERNLYVNCDSTTGLRDTAEEDPTTRTCRGLRMSQVNVDETISKRPSIIRTPRPRTLATEDSDNPFTRGGELSRKADFILRHSTFSRTGLRILDPDCMDSRSTADNELPDPLPLSPEVFDRDGIAPPARLNTEEEEGGAGLSDGENDEEPCSVTTSLVSPTDRDIDQATADSSHLARLNGKHPAEGGSTRVINSRTNRYESSSPALDSGAVSSRTRKCRCCLLQ